jgi:hypothetical protein
VPLVIQEMQYTMPIAPLAFMPVKTGADAGFELVALLSPVPGRNLYLRPDHKWVAGYVPAWVRLYPFRPAPVQGGESEVLCIDSSAICQETEGQAHLLFNPDGKVSPSLKKIMQVATEYAKSRATTQKAVHSLNTMGLIKKWPIKLKDAQGAPYESVDAFHIDGQKLSALNGSDLEVLNRNGGLQIAYAQLLSEQRSAHFERLLRAWEEHKHDQVSSESMDIDSLFGAKDDTLKFGF